MSPSVDLTEPLPDLSKAPAAAEPGGAADPPAVVLPDGDDSAPPSAGAGRLRRMAANAAWGLVGFAVLIGLWALAASRVPELPTPAATFDELRELLADPFHDNGPNDKGIGLQLATSLQRVFYGFGLAAVAGVPLGLLMGASRRVWQAADPVVQMLRPISPLAWFPIWLVILKDAPQAAVWVIFVTALWPVVINTAAGASTVPRDNRNVSRVFQFGRWAYVRHVLLPHTLPSVVTGLRQSMGVAWMVIVAVEMLSGGVGIGSFVWVSYNALDMPKVVSALVLIGAVGLTLDLLFLRLGRAVALEEVAS